MNTSMKLRKESKQWYDMTEAELTPIDSRASFYGKALLLKGKHGTYLRSYTTMVCAVSNDGEVIRLWHGYSATTMRHINSFMKYNGLPFVGKTWWDSLPVAEVE